MDRHVTTVGVMSIVFGVLGLLAALVIFTIFAGGGLLSGDDTAFAVTTSIGSIIAFFISILAIPEIIGGIFLLQRKEWARILILILSFVNLLNIPLGTIIGGYSIWVLMNDQTIVFFRPKAADSSEATSQHPPTASL